MPHKIPVVHLNRLHTIKYQSRMHKKLSSLEQCAYFAYVQLGIIKWLHNNYNLFPFLVEDMEPAGSTDNEGWEETS